MQQLKLFSKQIKEKECLPTQGPHCFFINGKEYLSNSGLVETLSKDLDGKPTSSKIETLISRMESLKDKYLKANSQSINQVFSISPKVQMNLLMNFESYEIATQIEDVYMTEEKIVKFNIGHLKINFTGKLRITQPRTNGKADPVERAKIPNGAYSFAESDGKTLTN